MKTDENKLRKLYKISFISSIVFGLLYTCLITGVFEIGYWVNKVKPIPQIEGDSLPTYMVIDFQVMAGSALLGIVLFIASGVLFVVSKKHSKESALKD